MSAVSKFHERIRASAERYIASEKSDPFVRGRVEAHIRNGIVGYNDHGTECFYDAEPTQEMRKHPLTGEEYPVTVYKNIKRI